MNWKRLWCVVAYHEHCRHLDGKSQTVMQASGTCRVPAPHLVTYYRCCRCQARLREIYRAPEGYN